MNGAAQIEPPAAAADLLAAHQARAHDPGKPRRERMRRRDLVGIDDVAQIGRRQIFDARRALAAAAALRLRLTVAVAAPLDAIRQAERLLRHMRFGELFPGRRVDCTRHAGENLPLPHAAALPEGVENLVEALPVGMGGAEQRAQCRLERRRAQRGGRCQHLQRVARLGEPDAKAVVAQRAGKAGEPAAGARIIPSFPRSGNPALGPRFRGTSEWRCPPFTPPCRGGAR